jgi:putative transposase
MPRASDFRTARRVVYALTVHLVFTPRHRGKVVTERVFQVLRSAWETVCEDFGCELRECRYESDYVQLLVAYRPTIALSPLINSLKGVSARLLRSEALPEVERKVSGRHFWSPGYCAVTSGPGVPALEILGDYVERKRGGGEQRAGAHLRADRKLG